jgi:phospholipase C
VNSLGFPCYNHKTLVDLLEGAGKTWKYYAREDAGGILAAPNAIYGICQPSGYGGTCDGADFTNNVVLVSKDDSAPILSNITNCKLPAMSWVIPDGNWSDHAGTPATVGDGGPSWVAAIVNAVGNDKKCEGGQGYWSDTVILITWDDWGGYYDDVSSSSLSGPAGIGYPNGTGQQFVYGFRVPLLVVSAYAKQSAERAPYTGYISDYNHDFGSILNFIEYAFGQEGKILGAPCGIGPCEYPYADYFAPEIAQGDPFGLSDFFDFIQSPIPFRTIQGAKYPPRCFHKPKGPGCFFTYPLDADDDASEAATAK